MASKNVQQSANQASICFLMQASICFLAEGDHNNERPSVALELENLLQVAGSAS